jgi:hypothetical protein
LTYVCRGIFSIPSPLPQRKMPYKGRYGEVLYPSSWSLLRSPSGFGLVTDTPCTVRGGDTIIKRKAIYWGIQKASN